MTVAIDDPDVRQAVADFRPVVLRMRAESARAIALPPGRNRELCENEVRRMTSDMLPRAERLGISVDTLIRLINDDLDARARRGRPYPTRPTSRTLARDVSEAQARETSARAQLSAAQIELKSATAALVAAQERLGAYGLERR